MGSERDSLFNRKTTKFKVLAGVALVALMVQSGMLILALFEPPLDYSITATGSQAIDSEEFLRALAAVSRGDLSRRNQVTVFTNGESFYPAILEAIRQARHSVHLECYIFQRGQVSDRLLDILIERARAGVEVRLLVDAIGSATVPEHHFDQLLEAGGRVSRYHPMKWYTWPRINNRTHREIAVMDGTVGFTGGAAYADHWLVSEPGHPRWRDAMVRFDGEAVTGLQATFAQNWLEATGEMLVEPRYYPNRPGSGTMPAVVVDSSPTAGRSTPARILFQMLLAKAGATVHITSPYFLPDESLIGEIAKAVRERRVDVKIIVPGRKTDQDMVRSSSRGLYGKVLEAGARIFEYEPTMNHTKSLIVDGVWAVVGSTNMDSRSFGLNDEVNVAILDRGVAARLEEDFAKDLTASREVTLEEWQRRPPRERIQEWIGWLLARQQ
ncbi:MAG TPA: cardiolipin synthase [Bryobacteraceae bacterium]|nr:cardiolipin synthase [Bryobacteraceae bacterium]